MRTFDDEAGGLGEIRVFHGECNFGHAHGRALSGAVEDAVGHALGAEGFVALFTQDPGDGVDDVGFAATVGADDAGRAGTAESDNGAFTERLKADDFHFSELKQDVLFMSSTAPRLSLKKVAPS